MDENRKKTGSYAAGLFRLFIIVVQYPHMKFGLTCIFTLMLAGVPLASHAFSKDTVDRDSVVSGDGMTAAFMLTVPMGGFNDDIYVPVQSKRNLAYGTRENHFGFTIESGFPSERTDDGTVASLAVSAAEIVDGFYKVPAGTQIPFTFLTLMNVSEAESNIYRYRLTELPFFIGQEREPRHFTTGELKYLVTNYEALNYERDTE